MILKEVSFDYETMCTDCEAFPSHEKSKLPKLFFENSHEPWLNVTHKILAKFKSSTIFEICGPPYLKYFA